MINIHKDEGEAILTWKNGSEYPKSVVIADYQLFETKEIYGTPGWVSPEQCIGQCMNKLVVDSKIILIIILSILGLLMPTHFIRQKMPFRLAV